MISEVAARMLRQLRAIDTAGRYGGEEFALVLSVPGPGALVVAERWRMDVENEPVEAGQVVVPVTMSFGVATCTADMADERALVAAADQALYRAKDAGRNQVALAPDAQEQVDAFFAALPPDER